MLRMCGAQTVSTGQNTSFNINSLLAAVEGDKNTDNLLGGLIPQSGANFFIQNKQMIASLVDGSLPDIRQITPHAQGLPIPAQGSQNFFIGSGTGGAGLGMMQLGNLNVGELVKIGQQVIGQVSAFTSIGGGAAVAQLSNMQGAPITPGTTVTGNTSGAVFTFSIFFDSRIATKEYSYPSINTISNSLVTDSGEYIVVEDYITFYPSMNLTASVITS